MPVALASETFYTAHLVYPPTPKYPEPSVHWFCSLDGQVWVETRIDPRVHGINGARAAVGIDKNGNRTRYPLTYDRAFLVQYGATFLTGEKHV